MKGIIRSCRLRLPAMVVTAGVAPINNLRGVSDYDHLMDSYPVNMSIFAVGGPDGIISSQIDGQRKYRLSEIRK